MRKARTKRKTYRYHKGVVQLAAQLSRRSTSTVYGVLHKRFKSAHVERAIERARAIIRESGEAA